MCGSPAARARPPASTACRSECRRRTKCRARQFEGANIFYANNAIDLEGLPANSPLVTRPAVTASAGHPLLVHGPDVTTVQNSAQNLGNLLATNSGTLGVSGNINSTTVAWYTFSVDLQARQSRHRQLAWPTIFDVDYADGLAHPL